MTEATTKKAAAMNAPRPMVDMAAHNGLRGACAMWVVLGHCLNSVLKMNGRDHSMFYVILIYLEGEKK
jgi:hypothetical protein